VARDTRNLAYWYKKLLSPRLLLGGWFIMQAALFFLIQGHEIREILIWLNVIDLIICFIVCIQDIMALEYLLRQGDFLAQLNKPERLRTEIEGKVNYVIMIYTFIGPLGCLLQYNIFFQVSMSWAVVIVIVCVLLLLSMLLSFVFNSTRKIAG
jgi:hypothetical protein